VRLTAVSHGFFLGSLFKQRTGSVKLNESGISSCSNRMNRELFSVCGLSNDSRSQKNSFLEMLSSF
jgi:hypothetical protein